jgi:PAS domain S-box-containing protein
MMIEMAAATGAEPAILFVDDEEIIRKSFSRDLRLAGFRVTAVGGGEEAVRALAAEPFELLITDLMMPDMDGFAVLKAAKEISPFMAVIILTGYGDIGAAIDALRLGADDFTQKPCEIEELVFRIRRCLEKRTLLQRLTRQNHRLEEEIAQRKQIEAQLLESENRFRLALDASSNGVWDYDLASGTAYFGENWHSTLGYGAREGFTTSQAYDEQIHPEDRERVIALRQAHIRGETPRYEAEYRIRSKAGTWLWILSRGQVLQRDEQGRALRLIGTHTDISRLKEVEAELVRARTDLEERVRERTAELSEANIALTVLLKKREGDRELLAERVLSNAAHLLEPFLDRLRESRLSEQQRVLVEILTSNLSELTSPFTSSLSGKLARLTPAEIQVANLVKLGKRTKEIAAVMHLSPGTISIHRKNIRKKLALTHQKTNLQTALSIGS